MRFFGKSVKTCKSVTNYPVLKSGTIVIFLTIQPLFIGGVVAQEPPPNPPSQEQETLSQPIDPQQLPNAQQLLVQAVQALESRHTVSARLLLGVNLYGEQMVGSGTYREEEPARSRRLRLEINIQHGDQVARVLRVCDGKRFWDYEQIFMDQPLQLASYDVERIERALEKAGRTTAQNGEPWPLTAGLVKLLRALRDTFVFDAIQTGTLDDVPVWRLEGGWRPEWLVQLMPDQKKALEQGQPINPSKFGLQQPDRVVLYLRQNDLFLRRMECLRSPSAAGGSPTVLVYLQLDPVELDTPIDSVHFTYNPGDVKFPDFTDAFLRQRNLRD